MKLTTVKWHPLGQPVPPGWRIAQDKQVMSVSNHHQVMIAPTERKNGVSWIVDDMPLGWMTARALAKQVGRERNVVGVLLLRSWKKGFVERREGECECCGERMLQWRRVK